MESIAIIIFGGGCFALGMYVHSQVSYWIDCKVQDKLKKDGNNKKG